MIALHQHGRLCRATTSLTWLSLILQCMCLLVTRTASAAWTEHPGGGYVTGNFGISAQVFEVHGPEFWIRVNPPQLGVWLQNFAHGELWVREAGATGRKLPLRAVKVSRLYPEYEATFESDEPVRVEVNCFAPLSLEAETGFLPGLILQATVEADRPWSGTVGYSLRQAKVGPGEENAASRSSGIDASDDDPTPWPPAMSAIRTNGVAGGVRGRAFLAAGGVAGSVPAAAISVNGEGNQLVVSIPIKVNAGSSQTVTFAAGSFDAQGRYTREERDVQALARYLILQAKPLHEQLHAFVDALPRTGDAKIDDYLRWYVSAGILLTKADREGHVLTMGYRELNQRDSFWTSGLHLVFWRDLERTMLLESAQNQLPSGRIPTTILPVIDRGDEIDSSEYFVLRAARDYRWYREDALLAQVWPAIRKALDYLASRDSEHVGVPMQRSYWADWKDVPLEQGRKYAPHFALLWLSSLRAASELALVMKDAPAAARYSALAERAAAFINRPYAEGGLWNGRYYVERWTDGKLPPYLLEDQLVGAYFDVIAPERLNLIYQQARVNETPWGVREKFPYQPGWAGESGTAGNYHNGGIWPYLNFVDATGRYTHGRAADAERILREVGQADLEAQGDEQPGEYLNGDSGANRGFSVQGWDAAMFSALYFGAFGLERTSASTFQIHAQIPPPRDFSTRLVLPACQGTLTRRGGKLAWEDEGRCRRAGVSVLVRDDS